MCTAKEFRVYASYNDLFVSQKWHIQQKRRASRTKEVCVSKGRASVPKRRASEQKICAQPKSLEFMHHTMICL